MIYDAFLFNGEKEVLDIRVKELESINVKHIAIQSTKTFTGNDKELKIYPYKNVEYLIINNFTEGVNAWDKEAFQRDYIMNGLLGANDNDIVIISDADEIPSLEAVKSYNPEMGLTALLMNNYWYKFNWLTQKEKWIAPKIMTYGYLKKTTPNEVRNSGYESTIENGGWHFSYLGDADYIVNKIESFSHQEYNTPQYKDKEEIKIKIETGMSLWGDSKFEKVEIDDTFPAYLRNNKEKFIHLIA